MQHHIKDVIWNRNCNELYKKKELGFGCNLCMT